MIQELIKTMAQSQQIQSSTQREFKGQNQTTAQALRGQGPICVPGLCIRHVVVVVVAVVVLVAVVVVRVAVVVVAL